MNRGLQRELSFLAGCAAAGLYLLGRPKLAKWTAATALALPFLRDRRFSYEGKVVAITGGSRGLGFALARELLSQGAKVALLARDKNELADAVLDLGSETESRVLPCVCDVTNAIDLQSTFQEIVSHFGAIDVLVNNAGSVLAGPVETFTLDEFQVQLELHMFSVLKAIRLAMPIFEKQGEGRIVNISSVGGRLAAPHLATYSVSKFALTGLSEALTSELAKNGVCITTVFPGLMRTGSPVQGVFKGESEKEFAWFTLMDTTPGLSMSARRAARQILRAVAEGERQVILSLPAKIGIFVHDNFPEIFHAVMSASIPLFPQGKSYDKKTGAQIRSWFDLRPWTLFHRTQLDSAGESHNQREHFDADFNLGFKDEDESARPSETP